MPGMTRAEHLAWCKQRALEYLPNDPGQALSSMASDLGKHDETRSSVELCNLGIADVNDPHKMREFINGFN